MIPKIAFTYWEGDQFTRLHSLTVETFALLNPTFQIFIYYPKIQQVNIRTWNTFEQTISLTNKFNINTLKKFNNVKFIEFDFNDEKFQKIKNSVHRADCIRIIKLYEHGGIWFDFDILFINQIPEEIMTFDKPCLITYENIITTGFICSPEKNAYIGILTHLLDFLITSPDIPIKSYQIFGPSLWTYCTCCTNINELIYLNPWLIYPFKYDELDKLYKKELAPQEFNISNVIGIHWYNGSPISRTFLNSLDFSNLQKNSLMEILILFVMNKLYIE